MMQRNEPPITSMETDESRDGDIEEAFHDDEDDESSVGSLDTNDTKLKKEKVVIATDETKRVSYLRLILMLVLACVAGCVSFAVFHSDTESEQKEFEAYAREGCRKVVADFESSAARRVGTIDSFATSIASNAKAQGQTWPNVTVPDYEKRATRILDLAEVMSLTLLPLVTEETVEGWGAYMEANQGWFKESRDYQDETGTAHDPKDKDVLKMDGALGHRPGNVFKAGPWRMGGGGGAVDSSKDKGPYMPWWQSAPCWPNAGVVGMDLAPTGSRMFEIRTMLATEAPVMSTAYDYSDPDTPGFGTKLVALNLMLRRWKVEGKKYESGPVSDLYFPIFESDKLVGALTTYIYWQAFFEDVLQENSHPFLVVLENSCGKVHKNRTQYIDQQQFTYEVRGKVATYKGPGDLSDPKYAYLEETTGWNAFLAGSTDPKDVTLGQCLYNVHVYPTREAEDALSTNDPLHFMLVVLSTFVFTSCIFLLYDYFVERRQKIVLTKAIKSTEVVQELFPEQVRDRLFEENTNGKTSKKGTTSMTLSSTMPSMDASSMRRRGGTRQGAAVADFYENCTILFADLAGFTKWSSTREPSAIFELLETLYGAFDHIAKKRGVFKVETIGDCYLAITGVPKPQKDHALIMAKFAGDCALKMNHVIHGQLVDRLGEETSELKLRTGIHSGSVTAGVLRGERARFQLFGDTVNTASRMESTSLPGMIQVSSSTAELITAAGKSSWLTEREGGVEAKGKGRMATWWLHPKHTALTSSVTSGSGMDASRRASGNHITSSSQVRASSSTEDTFRISQASNDTIASTDDVHASISSGRESPVPVAHKMTNQPNMNFASTDAVHASISSEHGKPLPAAYKGANQPNMDFASTDGVLISSERESPLPAAYNGTNQPSMYDNDGGEVPGRHLDV